MTQSSKTSKNVRMFWIVSFTTAIMFGLVMVANESSRSRDLIEQSGGIVDSLPKIGKSSDFEFTSSEGKKISQKDLVGKVWIMNLMFTSCEGPCPLMSHHMSRLQRNFQREDLVKFVSLTVDPETDTVPVLKEYAKKYSAVPGKWHFLTGEKKKIVEFAVNALKLPAGENPMLHSTRFVLIDKAGSIRGYYDSQERAQMERLRSHIKLLLEQSNLENI